MTDKIPEDFSAIDPAKVRLMEVRDCDDESWEPRSIIFIKNGNACDTDDLWWEQYRELPIKKMRPMTVREIMDFCRKHWPEVSSNKIDGDGFLPFWSWSFEGAVSGFTYRLADGTEGKFEVEE